MLRSFRGTNLHLAVCPAQKGIKPAAIGLEPLSVAYSLIMRKHPAALLLTVLVALGTGQAVPLSVYVRLHPTSAIEQVVKSRRNQHVRRRGLGRAYSTDRPRVSYHNDRTLLTHRSRNAQLLRAPPFSSLA